MGFDLIPRHGSSGQRHHARGRWTSLLLAIVLTACGPAEPSHDGKCLAQWFVDALDETASPRDVEDAFAAMGVEAVPFLVRQVRVARQELAAALTNTSGPWLGRPVEQSLRALGLPAGAPSPDRRRHKAYQLLAAVAGRERERTESGEQDHSRGLTNGFPLLREALGQPRLGEWIEASDVVGAAGPPAAEFLPALLALLTNAPTGDPTVASVVLALGRMKEAALPAIPHLTAFAGDARQSATLRYTAASALGRLGPASRSAAPVITSLLSAAASEAGEAVSRGWIVSLTYALASIGETPDAAMPVLQELVAHTNNWPRVPALIALRNRQPDDPGLQAEVRNALAATNSNPKLAALTILARLGTNAAVDRQLGLAYGAAAVQALNAAQTAAMVAFVSPPIKYLPLGEGINKVRTVPADYEFLRTAQKRVPSKLGNTCS